MRVFKLTVILITLTLGRSLFASEEGRFHIVTKRLQGLPSKEKSDGKFVIRSMKPVKIQAGSILTILPWSLHRKKGYALVIDQDSGINYFISNKWLDRGTQTRGQQRTFDFKKVTEISKYIKQIGTLPQNECLEGHKEIEVPQKQMVIEVPENEKELLSEGLRYGANSYQNLKRVARSSISNGDSFGACKRKLNRAYQEIRPTPIWKDLTQPERAARIYRHAQVSLAKIRETSTKGPSGNHYSDWTNAHYIHSDIGPEVASCISFIETEGSLNPHAINYSFCQANNFSTAHGLGQQTKRTFKKLINHSSGNLMPITTREDLYDGLSDNELFDSINDDVGLQMEVLFRYFNMELKFNGRGIQTKRERILKAVAAYDRDSQSRYLRKFEGCYDCMHTKEGVENPYRCYQQVRRTQ